MMALDNASEGFRKAPRSVGVGIVAIYRAAISPVIHALNGPACRFEPSCSEYARDAIATHGMIRGGAMAIWRIARCNPVGGHGFDPVPDGIVNREEEVHPHPRSGAASPATERARRVIGGAERDTLTWPSPSSSPKLGEETE
jgi:putative membrane protein insertion efficiency factor